MGRGVIKFGFGRFRLAAGLVLALLLALGACQSEPTCARTMPTSASSIVMDLKAGVETVAEIEVPDVSKLSTAWRVCFPNGALQSLSAVTPDTVVVYLAAPGPNFCEQASEVTSCAFSFPILAARQGGIWTLHAVGNVHSHVMVEVSPA